MNLDDSSKDVPNSLKMTFLLKIDNGFFPEAEILGNLRHFQKIALTRRIDLVTTDGALSIQYKGDELLGIKFWDEINFIVNGLTSRLTLWKENKVAEEYMGMQSTWIRLIPDREFIIFERETTFSESPPVKYRIRMKKFCQELLLVDLRMVKILMALGSTQYANYETNFLEYFETNLIQFVEDPDEIKRIAMQPIQNLVTSKK